LYNFSDNDSDDSDSEDNYAGPLREGGNGLWSTVSIQGRTWHERRTFNFHLGGIYAVTVTHSLVKNTVIRKALLDFIQALFVSLACFDL